MESHISNQFFKTWSHFDLMIDHFYEDGTFNEDQFIEDNNHRTSMAVNMALEAFESLEDFEPAEAIPQLVNDLLCGTERVIVLEPWIEEDSMLNHNENGLLVHVSKESLVSFTFMPENVTKLKVQPIQETPAAK